jgi:hypothetical protein
LVSGFRFSRSDRLNFPFAGVLHGRLFSVEIADRIGFKGKYSKFGLAFEKTFLGRSGGRMSGSAAGCGGEFRLGF